MRSTRREFIKDAALVGTVVAVGTGMEPEVTQAGISYDHGPADETRQCPYFDQPLLCNGITRNGKLMCEE